MKFLLLTLSGLSYFDNVFGQLYLTQEDASTSEFCDSYECDNSDFSSTLDVWCSGYESCYGSAISTSGSGDDVFCVGHKGCYSADITVSASGGDIYAMGYLSAYLATLDTADDIFCNGDYSCYYANIDSSSGDDVSCDGYYSCAYSDIINMNKVTSYGYRGLEYASIDSTGETTLDINLYGYQSGYELVIYCQAGSTCNLECGSSDGCMNTDFYCYSDATCSYNCDDSDYCPTLYESTMIQKMENNNLLTAKETDEILHEMELKNKESKKLEKEKEKSRARIIDEKTKDKKLFGGKTVHGNTMVNYNNINAFIVILSLVTVIGWGFAVYLYIQNKQYKKSNQYQLI